MELWISLVLLCSGSLCHVRFVEYNLSHASDASSVLADTRQIRRVYQLILVEFIEDKSPSLPCWTEQISVRPTYCRRNESSFTANCFFAEQVNNYLLLKADGPSHSYLISDLKNQLPCSGENTLAELERVSANNPVYDILDVMDIHSGTYIMNMGHQTSIGQTDFTFVKIVPEIRRELLAYCSSSTNGLSRRYDLSSYPSFSRAPRGIRNLLVGGDLVHTGFAITTDEFCNAIVMLEVVRLSFILEHLCMVLDRDVLEFFHHAKLQREDTIIKSKVKNSSIKVKASLLT
ncbi:hypothetical protein KSP40_PGU004933 [Platanthera guangdongensis]|uniref:Uncharacterized protein n=1 Tax=Platanthera guangdongensis TaxID=2320717 RepID=A0ABR2N2I2_9ASPA